MRVYRFRDYIVLDVGAGAERYLHVDDAVELGFAVQQCALDVYHCTFDKSTFSDHYIDTETTKAPVQRALEEGANVKTT